MEKYIKQIQKLLDAGTPFVTVTLVETKGSTPRAQGGRMIATEKGLNYGTVGGGLLEAKALTFSIDFLKNNKINEQTKFVHWNLNRDIGMSCGGSVKLFFERFNTNIWEIVIYGAGHVAQALIPLLLNLESHVTCLETRQEWLDKLPNSPKLKKICVQSFEPTVAKIARTAFVLIMTQGHRSDFYIAQRFLKQNVQPFLGVIGSRSKAATLQKELKKEGIKKVATDRLICPLGFSLGGNNPQEIAISISSQLLYERDKLYNKIHPRNPLPENS